MLDSATERFTHGVGLDDEVLTEFGVSRESFVERFREILLLDPPDGLDDADVAELLRACASRYRKP